MNILFLLTPKAKCAYLRVEDTVRQALEKMESCRYAALPILAKDGSYCGTLTEGDLLWAIKNLDVANIRDMENYSIMKIPHRKDNQPVSVSNQVEDLLVKAVDQNFVPVVDDRDTFIGIITRRASMQYFMNQYVEQSAAVAQ